MSENGPPERPLAPPPKPGDRVAAPTGAPQPTTAAGHPSPRSQYPLSRRWSRPSGPIPPTNGAAIAAIVLAFIVPPAGLALGIVGAVQVGYTGEAGRGLAIGAIWVSAILILVWTVALIATA